MLLAQPCQCKQNNAVAYSKKTQKKTALMTLTLGGPPSQMLVVHGIAGPLHLLLRLPLPQFDCQAAALLGCGGEGGQELRLGH